MTRLARRVVEDRSGAAAIEFAFALPALILFIVGIAQLGLLFMANAGLGHAVAEGARYATIHPRPSDAQIRQYITDSRFGLDPAGLTTPSIVHGTSDSANYVDISMRYTTELDFIFFTLPGVTLTETRRAFVQPAS